MRQNAAHNAQTGTSQCARKAGEENANHGRECASATVPPKGREGGRKRGLSADSPLPLDRIIGAHEKNFRANPKKVAVCPRAARRAAHVREHRRLANCHSNSTDPCWIA